MAYGSSSMRMPKNSPKNNKGTHTMPDGTVMSGKTHTSSSRVVKKAPKKNSPKRAKQSKAESESEIPIEELKEGSFRRMLKIKKDDKNLMKSEANRLAKIDVGTEFEFRGNKFKMSNLMKKRATLAKTLMGLKKK